jgi:RND family efflux transporter MFP subunit
MRKYIKYIGGAAVVAIGSVIMFNKVYIPNHTYKVINPTEGNLELTLKGIGNVSSEKIYNITPYTSGKIIQLAIKNTDSVKKGQLLFSIDPVDLKLQLKNLKLSYIKSNYEIDFLKKELDNLDSKQILASKTYKRIKSLNRKKFSSNSELDNAISNLQSLNSQIESLYSRIKSAKVLRNISANNIEVMKIKIKNLKIYSPVDGFITELLIEEGQFISQNNIVLKIVDKKDLWINTKFDERISNGIKIGQKAIITLRSDMNKHYKGTVKEISLTSDLVTLERKVNVSFDEKPNNFYINEQAKVIIIKEKLTNVLLVPSESIVTKKEKNGLWTERNGKAYFKNINIIGQNDNQVAIDNINSNTDIILENSGKQKVTQGQKIYK